MKKKRYEEEYDRYEEEYDEAYDEAPRRRFPFGLIVVLLVFALMAWGVYSVMHWYKEVDGAGTQGPAVTVMIDQGASAADIAAALHENGIVETEWLFKLYAKYSGKANNLQPGDVDLRPGMSYNEILKAISTQRVFRKTLTLTFPEGYTAVAIAQLMEQNGLCSADQFLACANGEPYTENDGSAATADFSDYTFWTLIPEKPGRLFKCEGYLFPETYQFFEDDRIENYVRIFYNQFEKMVTPLRSAVDEDPNDCINSLDDAVILASFIQEEAGLAEEDPKVSACFRNRLETDDPLWSSHMLESNASCDIMQENDNNYLWNSPMAEYMGWRAAGAIPEEVLAAYDTYRHVSGLPAGAISNPGYAAIEAALKPDREFMAQGYFFFVTGNPNGNYPGQYFYAKTAAEHSQNVAKAGW